MAVTDFAPTVRLDETDIPAGLALSDEAGWNQNDADWRLFLTRGEVFGIRDHDGRLIATSATLPCPPGAWISMVLVTARARRRGLATRLVRHCIEALRARGLTPWLDATPAGEAVYAPMGFVTTLGFQRLRLAGRSSAGPAPKAKSSGVEVLIARDRQATGHDRRALLHDLCARPNSKLYAQDETLLLVRDGRMARQIGPVYGRDPAQIVALIGEIAAAEAGPHIIDLNEAHTAITAALVDTGWTIERPFRRMSFGAQATRAGEVPVAFTGPEFG